MAGLFFVLVGLIVFSKQGARIASVPVGSLFVPLVQVSLPWELLVVALCLALSYECMSGLDTNTPNFRTS